LALKFVRSIDQKLEQDQEQKIDKEKNRDQKL
jgi:hypothetical protein